MSQANAGAVIRIALCLLSATMLAVLYPRFDYCLLAPVALTPLLVAAAGESALWRRFLLGEMAGFLYWFGVCYWIQFVLAVHGGMGEAGGWAVFALFCAAKAVHLGVFTALAGPLIARTWAIPAIAALWTGLERTHGTFGFAWLALGNAGVSMSVPMRLAPIAGVYGISFVFAMMGGAAALAILGRPRRQLLWLAALPLLYLLPELPAPEPGRSSALVAQPNFTGRSMDSDRVAVSTIEAALRGGAAAPEFIAWPEAPAPLYFDDDPRFAAQARSIARLAGVPFLFGTVAFNEARQPLNSAVLLAPSGAVLSRYDKMYLVPFGEFVPPLLGFVNRITQEAGDFAPGSRVVVAEVSPPSPRSPVKDHRVGAFICYESAFPELVRRFTLGGANVLVNLSNDGYFGRTAAREQHLLLARMRAAENGRWLLRPTNDGITAAIDPAGRVADAWPAHEAVTGRLAFNWEVGLTPYAQFGDWFAWSCLAAGLIAAAAARRGRIS